MCGSASLDHVHEPSFGVSFCARRHCSERRIGRDTCAQDHVVSPSPRHHLCLNRHAERTIVVVCTT
jgi:hypothetical protein